MAINDFNVGDFVHARKTGRSADGREVQVLTTEFTITAINGSMIAGNTLLNGGVNLADGWTLELISREVAMPDEPAEIVATRFDNAEMRIVGKGNVWTDVATGQPVNPKDLKRITRVA